MAKIGPIGGTAYVRVGDKQMALRGDLVISSQSTVKTGVAGMDGQAHGFTTNHVLPYIEGSFSNQADFPAADLEDLVDATVTAELDNGQVFVLSGAFVSGEFALEVTEGKRKVKFEGGSMSAQKP